jgi:hypothetical protein
MLGLISDGYPVLMAEPARLPQCHRGRGWWPSKEGWKLSNVLSSFMQCLIVRQRTGCALIHGLDAFNRTVIAVFIHKL